MSRESDRLEDQGEWERCTSYNRMFLALHDAGKSMDRVAEALLVLTTRYRPASESSYEAAEAYWKGGADNAQARPVYMVFCLIAKAIDEPVEPKAPPGGGALQGTHVADRGSRGAGGSARRPGDDVGHVHRGGLSVRPPVGDGRPLRLFTNAVQLQSARTRILGLSDIP